MGVVYLAHAPDGRQVSVKTLRPWLVAGADGRRRFEREVATLRRVRGDRVAEVVDADVDRDPPYIVTRYVDGASLTRLVGEHGPMRGDALLRLGAGLLDALRSVHSAGVVHRDVKPANVLMADDGPVLIDFGIAHAAEDTRLTATGFISGTPGYLAPETVLGHGPGAPTDVHGWAATMVFAATGRPPYGQGPDIAVFDRIRRGEHDLSGIEPGLARLLAAALRTEPSHRPGVGQVSAALKELAAADVAETVTFDSVGAAAATGADTDPGARYARDDETVAVPRRVAGSQLEPRPTPPGGVLAAPAPAERRRWIDHAPFRGHESSIVLVLGAVLLVLLLSWAPYAGAVVGGAAVLAGRLSWRIERRLFERRQVRGARRHDRWVVALTSPWELLWAMVPAAGQAAFAMGCALVTGGVVSLWDGAGLRAPYVCGALVGLALIWRGPGAVRVRRGLRILAEPLDHAPRAAWISIGALALLVCLTALSWESYGAVWWPAEGSPSSSVSFLSW
ncbi:protein kinase-like protein [Haloactinopolyspora alba]|uniref:Protein kinase-like protein n=2 Tax=Haloactinopolyspora alba TaxID=648780 RepID=A0A2P8DK68_9ACTN|nr:protein kinase-like protein [Haloactinopolyspora alba]